MTNAYPKRLIEVDLPIARISAHSRREKSIRHGHISTLHMWWARRPLAACRAIVCASLWPDPVDLGQWAARGTEVPIGLTVIRPERFLAEVRKQMGKWSEDHLVKASPESFARMVATQKDPSRLSDPAEMRAILLDFIADFANWDNSVDPDYLATARALTQSAHEALGGEPGTAPLVVDPFAGGGSIPLEALRVGADAFGSDLNPVAALLEKIALEYIPRHGQVLADGVRMWGKCVREEAANLLGELFPRDTDGATPIAYFWARTIVSQAPGEEAPVEVPLLRSMWLAKKDGRRIALRWVRNGQGVVQTELTTIRYADGVARTVRRPLLELTQPQHDSEVEAGTVSKGSATCPVTGFTEPIGHVRDQLASRRGGADDARLLCVASIRDNKRGRSYRLPTGDDQRALERARTMLVDLESEHPGAIPLIPREKISTNELRRISLPLYGIASWNDLFAPRQALTIATLVTALRKAESTMRTELGGDLCDGITACLACAVDRVVDQLTSIVTWLPTIEAVSHTFTRQALPIVWDFVEPNVFAGAGADFMGAIEWVAKVCEREGSANLRVGTSMQTTACAHPLPDDAADALVTDPPYYDAVPYAYLSDFFYVWLRRMLSSSQPALTRDEEVPKADEIVVDRPHYRSKSTKDVAFYEAELTKAFGDSRRLLKPTGIATVVFASKSTASWEAILQATVDSGFVITASWPIDTEREARVSAVNQARLASSIHLVCRPRENLDGSLRSEVGEWREVLAELPVCIREWMPRLADEGVVGADAIFACLGPALEVFSRYSSVEKASGEAVSLREYLEQVWAAVSQEALGMIFDDPSTAGLEPDARLTAMWLWTIGANAVGTGANAIVDAETPDENRSTEAPALQPSANKVGYTIEFDAARKIAQGLGIHLEKALSVVEVKGDKARLLPVAERTRYLFGKDGESGQPVKRQAKSAQLDLFAELQEVESGVPGTAPELAAPEAGKTALDRVHQAMILFAAGRGEALKRFLVEDGIGKQANLWKLAQALSALYPTGSDEKRWVDGVLARKKGLGL